ncbi:hypothetical protein AVEN_114976-1 [Araneus ventricosus]|uniref:Uncharacterized protein n=1 Tax=Araneus ventricosus TaxID=182803 RepID=A0A4Y2D829_ARAVE|nr:hypothetical protein AVEN_114976-1 [Araneus ventricosus]
MSPFHSSVSLLWGTFGHSIGFSVGQTPYTAELQWNRVSKVEPSVPEAGTLPVGYVVSGENILASVDIGYRVLVALEEFDAFHIRSRNAQFL